MYWNTKKMHNTTRARNIGNIHSTESYKTARLRISLLRYCTTELFLEAGISDRSDISATTTNVDDTFSRSSGSNLLGDYSVIKTFLVSAVWRKWALACDKILNFWISKLFDYLGRWNVLIMECKWFIFPSFWCYLL